MHVHEDRTFDAVFPSLQRYRSFLHWTPVDVAARAVALLAPTARRKVLDVGAGVGKLCLFGAQTTPATWFGIERDAEMVRVAREAAAHLGVERRTCFLHGDITEVDWSQFNGFYLFNPFAEALYSRHADADAMTRRADFIANIDFVQNQLARSAPGTRVVTYHGFGGEIPRSFERVHRETAREDELILWIQRSDLRAHL